jgi:hypothetical protein
MYNKEVTAGQSAPHLVISVPAGIAQPSVQWAPDGVSIANIFLDDFDVIQLLKDKEPGEMVELASLATSIGARALNGASQALDVTVVRQMLETHARQTSERTSEIIDRTRLVIDEQLNGENGTLLEPVRQQLEHVKQVVGGRLDEVKKQLDPHNPQSDLFGAINGVKRLLDPTHTDSVPVRLNKMLEVLAAKDGTLATAVQGVVNEALSRQIEPLCKQVGDLEKELIKDKRAKEIIQSSTAKGRPFEDEAFALASNWATGRGGWADHVGTDNQPGDIVTVLQRDGEAGIDLRIVIEARDDATGKGRKQVSDQLAKAMDLRESDAAIYCGKTTDAFGKEIGEWAEGTCNGRPWIACTYELLHLALRMTLLSTRLRHQSRGGSKVDSVAIKTSMDEIRTALRRITTIKKSVTEITTAAADVRTQCEGLNSEINAALTNAEQALNPTTGQPKTVLATGGDLSDGSEYFGDATGGSK